MSTNDATNPGADGDLPSGTSGVAEAGADTGQGSGQGEESLVLPDDDDAGSADGESGEGEGTGQPGEDEVEEFEHDGVKYAVPKALVPALMKDGDYTRKTQELGETRRQVEIREQAAAAHAAEIELNREVLSESAKLINAETRTTQIKEAIASFDEVDWTAALAADKANGTDKVAQAQLEILQLRRALEKAEGDEKSLKDVITQKKDEIAKKAAEKSTAGNALVAEQRKACEAACQREIPNWDKRKPQIEEFAIKNGVPVEQLQATTDPRIFKLLDLAFDGQRARDARKTQQRIAPALGAAAPVKRVTPTGSVPKTDPNRMSTAEWMKHRQAELAKKGRR